MNVNLTPQAREDLSAIRAWIAGDNERAAEQVVGRILQTAEMFGRFPMLGRVGRVEDTREFSVVRLPYVIIYAIVSETDIDVLTVVHWARLYPPVE